MTTELQQHLPEGWANRLRPFGYRTRADFLSMARVEGGAEALAGVLLVDPSDVTAVADRLALSVGFELVPVDFPMGCLPEEGEE